ncbi:MAG: 4-hydroxy-tetrahydrodipicolinate reductase [Verrucomicrobia bacterium]|jgi:4-hydroxy-tetrahydrodipicolinate reductase|nr:4-hydroxy-tetrahydrodipicolinate reductase [Verrucomicrobiota bacterium]
MNTLKVAICGACGRMGKTLAGLAPEEKAQVLRELDMGDDLTGAAEGCDAVIDFSAHAATPLLAEGCADAGIPLIIGTTGHSEPERKSILEATALIPIVWAGNYSVGVNLLLHLAETAGRVLADRYDAEITEVHHRHKKDAPSGTALALAEALQAAPPLAEAGLRHGREGETGERSDREIGVHALRGGEVIGEHTVFFFGEHDRIELTHRAADRRIFASGAFRAAHWAIGQEPGRYDMRDVLSLRSST